METKNNLYDENSIQSLSPLEFTRLRAGVYVGDTQYSTQLLIEVLSNSIDEFKAGHGSKIRILIHDDNTIIVEDEAQGILPNTFREDGKSTLEAVFSVLNTSGKYDENGIYEGRVLGLNGIGAKLPIFLSHEATVLTWRDGQYEKIRFVEGVFEHRESGEWTKKDAPSGTRVQWKPSEEFFDSPEINYNEFKRLMQVLVCLCPGLEIYYWDGKHNEEVTYKSENGLHDLVDNAVEGKEVIKNRLNINFKEGKNELDLVMTYTDAYHSTIVPYVNTGFTDNGPHITQFKTILTREVNKFLIEKGWLKEKDSKLSGDDIQEGLYVIFNLTAPGVAYDAQTKSRVVKLDMKPFTQIIAEELQYWMSANEKDIKQIADKAINARKAREAARKAREAARGIKGKKEKRTFLDLPTKLVDAWSKRERQKCEIYVVEGDSAANGLVQTRDSEFQAIFPIRGKMISAYKNTSEKIFANQEINNFIKAIGLELDTKSGKLIYDTKKLRYGRIIAAADADPDGKSIKNLLYTAIWWLCPELVINGHVYAALPPLYRITTKKNEYIFLKDDIELEEYKSKNQGKKFLISRNKG